MHLFVILIYKNIYVYINAYVIHRHMLVYSFNETNIVNVTCLNTVGACLCVCMYVCVCVCMCACLYVCLSV